jgi:hypothetical protein
LRTATKRPCRQQQVQLSGCVMCWRQRTMMNVLIVE